MPEDDASEPTQDRLLGGRMTLLQMDKGHRVGTDAVLLAMAAPVTRGLLIDAGAGVGAVGVAAALRMPEARLELLDIDGRACALARQNLAANGLESRARAVEVDLLSAAARRDAGLCDGRAGLVVTNPPFHEAGRVRASPDIARRQAHVLSGEGKEPLQAWIRAAVALAAPGGGKVLILYRADRLDALLAACAGRLGGLSVLPVHAKAGEPAIRVLVGGQRGSRAPMRLCAGLVLHEDDGGFTGLAQALHRGEAVLGGF